MFVQMGMSQKDTKTQTETEQNGEKSADDNSMMLTRRGSMQAAAGAAAMLTLGVGSAAAQESVNINFSADYVHNPFMTASATVVEHNAGMNELEYTADDGSTASWRNAGFGLAPDNDDGETPNNPVTLSAADIQSTEYTDFPRGEEDSEGEPISALDADHWTVTGTAVVSNADRDALTVSGEDGDTARFESVDITSGVARKWLQIVQDIPDLTGVIEYRVEDSTEATLTVEADSAGDTATDAVITDTTGPSQASQVRLGELGDLEDIVAVEIAFVGGSGETTIHGLNLEKESRWQFGTEQYYDAEDEQLKTQTVYEPSGDYSIQSLDTLPSEFGESKINGVSYDMEAQASELPQAQVWARVKDTPDTYTYPKELEMFVFFEAPTAYDLEEVDFGELYDVVEFPSGRYRALEAATGFDEPDSWDDVDSISWTDRSGEIGSDGEELEMLSPLSATDLVGWRARIEMSENRVDAITAVGGGGAVGTSGSSGFNYWLTTILGVLGGGAVMFRKQILGLIGRGN